MRDVNIISPAQFASFAPEVDTSKYDAPTISGMISQASRQVTSYLGYNPVAENITDEVKQAYISSQGDLVIYPVKLPIISVSAIALFKGATTISLNLLDGAGRNKFNVDYMARSLTFPFSEITLQGTPIFTNFYSLRGTQFYTKMSYRGGFEAYQIPFDIQQATIYYMREILARQYNPTGAVELRQGGLSFKYSMNGENKSDLVRDAERLLNPYRRIG